VSYNFWNHISHLFCVYTEICINSLSNFVDKLFQNFFFSFFLVFWVVVLWLWVLWILCILLLRLVSGLLIILIFVRILVILILVRIIMLNLFIILASSYNVIVIIWVFLASTPLRVAGFIFLSISGLWIESSVYLLYIFRVFCVKISTFTVHKHFL